MNYISTDFSAHSNFFLIAIVLIMGLRHGFDLDHLATIDAITRTVRNDTKTAKFTGFLFSLGHGLIVTLLSIIVGAGVIHFTLSQHIEIFGNIISITFLIMFGLINFYTSLAITKKCSQMSIKKIIFNYINGKHYKPIFIFCVGALFAISFDTFSQITLFALSASVKGGCFFSLLIGILFMIGMMIADGFNGLVISNVIYRADKTSLIISRLMGLTIAFFSVFVGVINIMAII